MLCIVRYYQVDLILLQIVGGDFARIRIKYSVRAAEIPIGPPFNVLNDMVIALENKGNVFSGKPIALTNRLDINN